jgi:hypothetical protein
MKNNYKNLLSALSFFFICIGANAQFIQTDEFDFWEDQSTHDYITDGATSNGAYNCSGDLTLRVGSCSSASVSSVSITLDVTPNCDSIKFEFLMPWGYTPGISIDGVKQAAYTIIPSCNYVDVIITNANSFSADGIITLLLEDTIPSSCSGDFQIARMKVYSSSTHVTGTSFNQQSISNKLLLFPNPSNGVLNIDYTSQGESIKEVTIVNTNGDLVYKDEVNLLSNNYTKHIDLSNMANGMYFVKVTTNSNVITKKITLLAD